MTCKKGSPRPTIITPVLFSCSHFFVAGEGRACSFEEATIVQEHLTLRRVERSSDAAAFRVLAHVMAESARYPFLKLLAADQRPS